MGKQDFDRYLQSTQVAEAGQEDRIDWQAEKSFWLAKLDELYTNIAAWLQEYIDQEKVRLEFKPIELNEDEIGRYAAREAIISMAHKVVSLTPIGTALVGAKGRVDLAGPAGVVRLVLADKRLAGPAVVYRQRLVASPQAAALDRQTLQPLGVLRSKSVV